MFADWHLFRRQAVGLALVALAAVIVVWNVPQLAFMMYPFRLFVTFIHEAGHGLAALVSGGNFIRFEVMANGSGLATTRGGVRAVIIPSGYLGAALFGSGLFYIVNRVPYPRVIAIVLSVALMALSLVYGQTSRIALTVGLAFAGVLLLTAWLASRYVVVFLLNVLAVMTALNAVLDLLFLTQHTHARTSDGRVLNDAAAFSQEITPRVPPNVWAWAWAAISALLLGWVMYHSLVRPLLRDALGRGDTIPVSNVLPVYYEYADYPRGSDEEEAHYG